LLHARLAVALAAGLLATSAAAQPLAPTPPVTAGPVERLADPDPTVREDPGVRRGVLANGLRYALMSNNAPPDLVSLRLQVRVGSFDEADDQLGAAHFVEHMAFNGTRNFAENRLEPAFAGAGVAFGRDQNAFTSLHETRYRLDIPQADNAEVELGFRWLRDVADGLLFSPEAVTRERGVVLAEHGRTLGAAEAWGRSYRAFLAPELRGPTRLPIGTPESNRSISPEALRRFYRAWYRPENAEVSVVGGLPLDEMQRLVETTFASWTPPAEPAGTRAARRSPNARRGIDVLVRREPQLPAMVRACLARPAERLGPDSLERRRRQVVRWLWAVALQRRLTRLSQAADSSFANAAVGLDTSDREASFACLTALPKNDDWRGALSTVATETRRLQAHGVTAAEFRRDVAALRASLALAASRASLRQTPALADQLIDTEEDPEADTERLTTPAESLRLFDLAVAGLTPRDLLEGYRRDWTGAGPLISVTTPREVAPAQVRAAWTAIAGSAPPAAFVSADLTPWSYTSFGPAGRVARREELLPGFVRLTFDNGVVVNFKSIPFNPETVEVRVRFGEGQRGVANADYQVASLGSAMFASGGTGRHSQDQLSELFSDRLVAVRFGMDSRGFQLSGSTRASDLEAQLQLLAAYLSDPGFRDDRTGAIATAVDFIYRGLRASPTAALSLALGDFASPNSPRSLPPREALTRLTQADFRRVFERAVRDAPLEVTVVGDVDEATATRLLASTLGALPRRTGGPRETGDTYFVRYPADRTPVRTTHEGDQGRAAVALVWPLWVAEPTRRREEWSVQLLTRVFADKVRRRVREDLGLTYSPSVDAELPDYDDQGVLAVTVETAAGDVEAVRAAVQAVARELATTGVDQASMDDSRRAWLTSTANIETTVGWWAGALNGSARNETNLRDQVTWKRMVADLTVADLGKAARDWLTQAPIVVIAAPAASTPPARR